MPWLLCESGGDRAVPIPEGLHSLDKTSRHLQSLVDAGRLPGDVRAWVLAWVPDDPDAIATSSDFGALT